MIRSSDGVLIGQACAWLEMNTAWLAQLFGLRATGDVRLVDGGVHIGVVPVGEVRPEQVLVGNVTTAIVPVGVVVKGAAPRGD